MYSTEDAPNIWQWRYSSVRLKAGHLRGKYRPAHDVRVSWSTGTISLGDVAIFHFLSIVSSGTQNPRVGLRCASSQIDAMSTCWSKVSA